MIERNFFEIQGAFLVKIQDNTFNGEIRENVFEHINKFLELVEPIKIDGGCQDRFRLSIIPISLMGAAGTETYEEYELNNPVTRDLEEPWLDNGMPYQLCDHICEPYRFKNGITKWPTCSLDIDGFCNGGELPRMVRFGGMTYFQDHKWDDPTIEPSVCKIKRFEMMMYSFNAEEEYITIKESEYLNHSKDNLEPYRELLRIIDEGWIVATPDKV
uniref:Uncharacterized protein n=1 Tax=Tanacetum cinerariifolium TaxID=118510 RepID=A0A6L2L7X1_TANCI|nr:hypothetical protein [Tanacetum cinerariifolium]